MERRNAAWCTALLVLASLAACTAFEPRVGASQDTCNTGSDGQGAMSGSTEYATMPAAGTSMAGSPQTCPVVDGGSSCDTCESTYCCMTRLACFHDPVCVCADKAMDSCIESLQASRNPPTAHQIDECRDAFAARGTVEADRITCQEAMCASACAVP
jgi:hypothetical protein